MAVEINAVCDDNLESVFQFLDKYEESSQFLINNLREFGPRLTDYPHSGNFKLIRDFGEIVGVFFLTRVGNLLAQTAGDYSSLILKSCKEESIQLKGFIGDWRTIAPIASRFKAENSAFRPSFESKEILYRIELKVENPAFCHDPRVRSLKESDYDQWSPFRIAYEEELRLPSSMSEDERQKVFKRGIEAGLWWGLFDGSTLCSMTSLNSRSAKIGQVGGVFTPKAKRQRGLSKTTMLHMLKDCRDILGHNKNILFTGQTDIPAQKLYESIGYERFGDFALILS